MPASPTATPATVALARAARRSWSWWMRPAEPCLDCADSASGECADCWGRRQFYFVELVVAGIIALMSTHMARRRGAAIAVAAVAGAVWFSQLGLEVITARLRSFDVLSSVGTASVTNAGHLQDVVLGWQQVKQSPTFGLGVGVSYDSRVLGWKVDSFGVHNGPLTIWLIFGLLGLVAYAWWTIVTALLLRARSIHSGDVLTSLFARAGFAWFVAANLTSCFFSPWPFGAGQLATLLGVMLGATLARLEDDPEDADRPRERVGSVVA